MFEVTGPTHNFVGGGERMWVTITAIKSDRLEGTLDNQSVCFGHLDYSKKIKFSRCHIINYEYAEDMKAIADARKPDTE